MSVLFVISDHFENSKRACFQSNLSLFLSIALKNKTIKRNKRCARSTILNARAPLFKKIVCCLLFHNCCGDSFSVPLRFPGEGWICLSVVCVSLWRQVPYSRGRDSVVVCFFLSVCVFPSCVCCYGLKTVFCFVFLNLLNNL